MRLWAQVNSSDFPLIDAVLILGLTDGVLQIRYFSFSEKRVEGDHWFPNAEEAKRDSEGCYGIESSAWQLLPDEQDELYGLSVMPIAGYTYDHK